MAFDSFREALPNKMDAERSVLLLLQHPKALLGLCKGGNAAASTLKKLTLAGAGNSSNISSPSYSSSSSTAAEVAEEQVVRCECCGLQEECTPAYIRHVQGLHCGRWVCGLCAEAVKEEKGGKENGVEEALQAHMSMCRQFISNNKPGDGLVMMKKGGSPVADLTAAMRRALRRSIDGGSFPSSSSAPSSPRRSGGPIAVLPSQFTAVVDVAVADNGPLGSPYRDRDDDDNRHSRPFGEYSIAIVCTIMEVLLQTRLSITFTNRPGLVAPTTYCLLASFFALLLVIALLLVSRAAPAMATKHKSACSRVECFQRCAEFRSCRHGSTSSRKPLLIISFDDQRLVVLCYAPAPTL